MLATLALTIPFFAVIFAGACARRLRFFDDAAGSALARFAFFVALPPFLFLEIAAAPVEDILNLGFVLRFEAATILIFTVAALIGGRAFGLRGARRAIFGLNAAYPNYGYIGVPLAILGFGASAAVPIALILLADSIVLVILTAVFAARDDADSSASTHASAQRALRQLLANPLLLSVVAGFVWALSGLSMPSMPQRLLMMLAGAAAPAALFALGVTLAGERDSPASARAEIAVITAFKLLVHPLLVAAFFILIPGADPEWSRVAILAACLPVAANVFVMAEFYNAYQPRTAAAITLSTLIAAASVPVVLYCIERWV